MFSLRSLVYRNYLHSQGCRGRKEKAPDSHSGAGEKRLAKRNASPGIAKGPVFRDAHAAGYAARLEWCLRHRGRPEIRSHPVVAALLDLYVSRLSAYIDLPFFARIWEPIGQKLMADLQELGAWVFNRRTMPWNAEDRDQVTGIFRAVGFTDESALETGKSLYSRSGGRPSTRRPRVIAALELKLSQPPLRWDKITREVCDCGRRKEEHDVFCTENLMAGLKKLRKLLRQYDHPLGSVKLKRK